MISGWLLIDKPVGLTSQRVVSRIKRALKADKVGHAGTLDPLASGVLPVAIGEATKLMPYINAADKAYKFTLQLGVATTTEDCEGEVTARIDSQVTKEQLEAVLPGFLGISQQIPPIFSALKMNGKRAYVLAREGIVPEMAPRTIEITQLELEAFDYVTQQAELAVECGKGTYVRSLARDIAQQAGSIGHVSTLRRTRVGKFLESQTIPLAKWEEMVHNDGANLGISALTLVLDDIPVLCVTSKQAAALRLGQSIQVDYKVQELVQAQCENTLVALGEIQQDIFYAKRVFGCSNNSF